MVKLKHQNKTVAVIGYGSQGRAIALNLQESGYDVIVGLRPRSKSRRQASADGIDHITTVRRAADKGDIIAFAFPDHLHSAVFEQQILQTLTPAKTLLFLAGMSIYFMLVVPPRECDVVMLAPHAPGVAVREHYGSAKPLSAFIAVHQDKSRRALATVRELAQAVGFDKKRLVHTTFEAEALGDLFGEQAVLCGGLAMLVKSGFETLVKKGLPAENAYLEVAYQLDLIVDLIKKHGIEGMLRRISVAARFGAVQTGPKVIDKSVQRRMEKVYDSIASGTFPKELSKLTARDLSELDKKVKQLSNPQFEKQARKYSDSD
ncbi:MAG: ketol-acid reductoisomerase [candidate division Zixibacteria bacterium]|nr:ketol-acid reductoisomerase [candidate division Zixibacteria bacterium]MDH3936673.1 ketol-acid reductoisomerase [candidate division Zixibacteria bacterium]MDH4035042.1 ketol-acid reductoisomerase [candidate division Zixibacteria bacterium]